MRGNKIRWSWAGTYKEEGDREGKGKGRKAGKDGDEAALVNRVDKGIESLRGEKLKKIKISTEININKYLELKKKEKWLERMRRK